MDQHWLELYIILEAFHEPTQKIIELLFSLRKLDEKYWNITNK